MLFLLRFVLSLSRAEIFTSLPLLTSAFGYTYIHSINVEQILVMVFPATRSLS